MSYTANTTIWCDDQSQGFLCLNHFISGYGNVRNARKEAKKYKWGFKKGQHSFNYLKTLGKDFCPDCYQKMITPATIESK